MKKCLFVSMLCLLFSGCVTNSYLRTSKTLEQGQLEITAGVALNQTLFSPVGVFAFGFTDSFETSLKLESDTITFSPRFQLLDEEYSGINIVTSAEFGTVISRLGRLQIGAGLAIGKTFGQFEPFVSYLFKYGQWPLSTTSPIFGFSGNLSSVHVINLGCRWNFENTPFFLQAEGGPAIWSISDNPSENMFTIGRGAVGFGLKFP